MSGGVAWKVVVADTINERESITFSLRLTYMAASIEDMMWKQLRAIACMAGPRIEAEKKVEKAAHMVIVCKMPDMPKAINT